MCYMGGVWSEIVYIPLLFGAICDIEYLNVDFNMYTL